MRYIVFKDPQWTVSRFNLATDFDRAMKADSDRVLGLTDPNLKPFFDRGGKLLMYHGWQDPQVPAQSSPRYFNEVAERGGQERRGNVDSALHGPRHEPLRGRARHRHVRQGGRD